MNSFYIQHTNYLSLVSVQFQLDQRCPMIFVMNFNDDANFCVLKFIRTIRNALYLSSVILLTSMLFLVPSNTLRLFDSWRQNHFNSGFLTTQPRLMTHISRIHDSRLSHAFTSAFLNVHNSRKWIPALNSSWFRSTEIIWSESISGWIWKWIRCIKW